MLLPIDPEDEEVRFVDSTIFRYVSSLAPLEYTSVDTDPASRRSSFLGVHAVAYLAFIRLHERSAPTDISAYSRCVQDARYIAMLPRQFTPDEIMELSPFALVSTKICFPTCLISEKLSPTVFLRRLDKRCPLISCFFLKSHSQRPCFLFFDIRARCFSPAVS